MLVGEIRLPSVVVVRGPRAPHTTCCPRASGFARTPWPGCSLGRPPVGRRPRPEPLKSLGGKLSFPTNSSKCKAGHRTVLGLFRVAMGRRVAPGQAPRANAMPYRAAGLAAGRGQLPSTSGGPVPYGAVCGPAAWTCTAPGCARTHSGTPGSVVPTHAAHLAGRPGLPSLHFSSGSSCDPDGEKASLLPQTTPPFQFSGSRTGGSFSHAGRQACCKGPAA